MSKNAATRDAYLIKKYTAAVSVHLRTARFGKGDPGDKIHVLVIDPNQSGEGNAKGRGEALCGATYAKPIVVRGTPGVGVVVCAKCEKVLARLARWIASQHNRDLFAQASTDVSVTVERSEVVAALAVPSIRADLDEVEWQRAELPEELLPVGSGEFVAAGASELGLWGVGRDAIRRMQGKKAVANGRAD